MSTTAVKVKPTKEAYLSTFAAAAQIAYPSVDDFERRCGYALDTGRLLKAAAVLACPVKAHAPHWQHGRVLYAAASAHISTLVGTVHLVDIGTAKAFSALCLQWALEDVTGVALSQNVVSLDVISPRERVTRNTIAEVDGLKTLAEILEPWPEARRINFVQSTGVHWLDAHSERVHVAFVDGKHTGEVVRQEGKLLAEHQERGDLAIFDDCQIPGVSVAVASLQEWYRIEYLEAAPRQYGIARRR